MVAARICGYWLSTRDAVAVHWGQFNSILNNTELFLDRHLWLMTLIAQCTFVWMYDVFAWTKTQTCSISSHMCLCAWMHINICALAYRGQMSGPVSSSVALIRVFWDRVSHWIRCSLIQQASSGMLLSLSPQCWDSRCTSIFPSPGQCTMRDSP
jgi:hypothetical protein